MQLVGPDLDTHYVQYMATAGRRKLNFYQRMGLVESGAARELKMQIMNNREKIERAFAEADKDDTGPANSSNGVMKHLYRKEQDVVRHSLNHLSIRYSNLFALETQEVPLTLYKAQIRSNLEYCSHIWGADAPTTLSILDAVHRRAIRLIGDSALTCHLQPLSHRRAVGYISVTEWCVALERATGLQIPWRMLKDKLVTIDPETNKVKYLTTFDIKSDKLNSVQGASTVVETLYRNKTSLEAIFRIIDKDNSGFISLDEFTEACSLIKEHMPCPMTHEQLEEICRLMDLNKDGQVDLNEFLESFRMVDPESRKKNQPCSPETYRNEINCRYGCSQT
nr:unnamed protein product [Callosobruchus chinensis]